MIDEKRLDKGTDRYGRVTDVDFTTQCLFTDVEMIELIRLARIGLWAEKHGVPALERFKKLREIVIKPGTETRTVTLPYGIAESALDALPKEET